MGAQQELGVWTERSRRTYRRRSHSIAFAWENLSAATSRRASKDGHAVSDSLSEVFDSVSLRRLTCHQEASKVRRVFSAVRAARTSSHEWASHRGRKRGSRAAPTTGPIDERSPTRAFYFPDFCEAPPTAPMAGNAAGCITPVEAGPAGSRRSGDGRHLSVSWHARRSRRGRRIGRGHHSGRCRDG